MKALTTFAVGRMQVRIYPDKKSASQAAALAAVADIRAAQKENDWANLVFSTGASQFDFVEDMKNVSGIDWRHVRAFHLDEYVGMDPEHPASFRRFLQERLFDHVRPGEMFLVQGDAADVDAECMSYEGLLKDCPIDIGFVGIGENGHIAFNDPPVADFEDPVWIKRVELDERCRRQQLGEGWFASLEQVPKEALSLTCSAIMAFRKIYAIVPEERKAAAVKEALFGPVTTACPASILREHPSCVLYLDKESASQLEGVE